MQQILGLPIAGPKQCPWEYSQDKSLGMRSWAQVCQDTVTSRLPGRLFLTWPDDMYIRPGVKTSIHSPCSQCPAWGEGGHVKPFSVLAALSGALGGLAAHIFPVPFSQLSRWVQKQRLIHTTKAPTIGTTTHLLVCYQWMVFHFQTTILMEK